MMITASHLLPELGVVPADRAAYEITGGYTQLRAVLAHPGDARARLHGTGLRGLGGAGFPFARKLALTLAHPGPRVVVCNAAEDEPGSEKDRVLLRRNPHLVLEGALIAAAVLEADDVHMYVSEGLVPTLLAAVAEIADDPGLGGVSIHVIPAPAAYVAGEASAVVSWLNGGEARPAGQPPYPSESGVGARPTLVANCETLANLPRLLDADPAPSAPTTRLATVSGDVVHPGVYEVEPATTTFSDLIALAGGVTGSGELKAIQPGGPSTAFLDRTAADVVLTDEAISAAGSSSGCLAVRVHSSDRCMVEEVQQITGFFAGAQCGQCPPCRMKTQTYHRTIHQISVGQGSWAMLDRLSAVEEFVSDMPRRCSLIDMPTPAVASARVLFKADFDRHIDHHTCSVSG